MAIIPKAHDQHTKIRAADPSRNQRTIPTRWHSSSCITPATVTSGTVARSGHVVTELVHFLRCWAIYRCFLLSEPGVLAKLFAAGVFFGCAGRVAEDAAGGGDGASGGRVVSLGMGMAW
jgi:hypothetical protein